MKETLAVRRICPQTSWPRDRPTPCSRRLVHCRHAWAVMAMQCALLELPGALVQLIFESTTTLALDPLEANGRIVRLLHKEARQYEREAAGSGLTQILDGGESLFDGESQGNDQSWPARYARHCREAIDCLSQVGVVITNGAEAVTEIPGLQGIPGLQSKIDRMLQCQFVPRRLAWHLACSCRTLRDLGMALPLLQPLVLKLASEAAACQFGTWQRDSDEEGEDEDGDYIPPRGLVSLRLLAAREVHSRLADLHISHDHQHLRKFMEIPDLAAHAASVSYRTGAADYGRFNGDARLCYGLRLGYGTAVRLLAAGRRWSQVAGPSSHSLPLSALEPLAAPEPLSASERVATLLSGQAYLELPDVEAVDAAIQRFNESQNDDYSQKTFDPSHSALQNMSDLKRRAGQADRLDDNELSMNCLVNGMVHVFFTGGFQLKTSHVLTGQEGVAGREVVIGVELCPLEQFGFDLKPEYGVSFGAGLKDSRDEVFNVSKDFVAGVLGWSANSALFHSVELELSSRLEALLQTVAPSVRAELFAHRRPANSDRDAWENATTMAAETGFHVVFNETPPSELYTGAF